MTSRGRILSVLKGETPDSLPVVRFIQEEYVAWYYPEKTHLDRVDTVIELAGELAMESVVQDAHAATREIVRPGKPGGRYFFDASDVLEKNTPIDDLVAMLAAAADEGGY